MIPRILHELTAKMATWFPVVSLTGPRQSGKSTLVRAVFPDFTYLNLEDPLLGNAANEDPVGFIRNRPDRLIIDEAQIAPDLFSMIQVVSDERNTPGQYVLSGSQNFLLAKNISQSLAGRVGILKLLPLSFAEVRRAYADVSVEEHMFRGGFPRLITADIPPSLFFTSYVSTYVGRDVSEYLNVRNLATFRKFLALCALNAGNLMNYASLAKDCDIDARTAKEWLSMLESSYVIFPLMPYFSNAGKRLVKTPKLYFHDTGLLCHLLGITSVSQLLLSSHLGAVFENFIVEETYKRHINEGVEPELYFYRDQNQVEVDLLDCTDHGRPLLVEIKSGQTYRDSFAKQVTSVGDMLGVPREQRYIVGRFETSFTASAVNVCSAQDWLLGRI